MTMHVIEETNLSEANTSEIQRDVYPFFRQFSEPEQITVWMLS